MMGGGFEDGADRADPHRGHRRRPVPAGRPPAWWLAGDLGRAAFQLLGRGVIPFVLRGAVSSTWRCPRDAVTWVAFLVSVRSAMVVSFAIRFLVALTAFWLLDGTGVMQTPWWPGCSSPGMMLPLNAFPGALGDVVRGAAVVGAAAGAGGRAAGRSTDAALVGAFAFQAAWAVVLLAAGRLLQSAATRRVVVQGG